MILVDLARVAARRPDRPLFEDLSRTASAGDRLGIVGRNGTGKSTLLRVLVDEVNLLILDEPTNHLEVDAIGW